MIKLVVTLIMVGTFLTGCGGLIRTSTTTFHGPDHLVRESIVVMPVDKSQQESLEFKAISDYLLKKLVEKGYKSHEISGDPTFTAFITYGVDNGRTSMTAVPMYGQTGGGTTYSSGTVSSYGRTATYSGTSMTMPTYGVVGSMPITSTEYKRQVNVDIWRMGQPPVKVYEMRGVSTGSCGNMSSVIFGILDGMFEKFPGENGKSNSTTVGSAGRC